MRLLKELLIVAFVGGMSFSTSVSAQNTSSRSDRGTTSSSRPVYNSNSGRGTNNTGIGSGVRPSNNNNSGIGNGARPSNNNNSGIGSGARPSTNKRPSSNSGIGSGARPNNNYTPNYRPNQGPDNNYGTGNRPRPNNNSGIGSGARPNNNNNGYRPNNSRPNNSHYGHHGAIRPGYTSAGDGPRHTGSSWNYRPRAPHYYRPVPRPSTWRYYPNSPVINSVFGIVFGSSMNYVINQLSRQYYNVVGYDGNTVYLENVRMDGYNWTYADLNFDNDAMYQAQYTNISTSNSIMRYENLIRYFNRLYGPAINAYNNGNNALRWFGRNNSIILEYNSGYSQEGVMLYYTTLSYNYDYIYDSIY